MRNISVIFFFLSFALSVSSLSAQNCQADFFYSTSGLTVQFTDSSNSNSFIQSYFWTFGNGGTSSQSNPTYTYSQPGTYSVCLTITDTTNCVDSICYNVTAIPNQPMPCNASFTHFVTPNNSVNFTSSITGGTAPYVFNWDFGNGIGTSALSNPTYFYPTAGIYPVTLIVTDANRVTCSFTDSISVNACIADFTTLQTSFNSFLFTNRSSGAMGASYSWDFGDGSTSTQINPAHTYTNPGNYAITLSVFDSLTFCSDQKVDSLIVLPCQGGFSFTVNNDTVFIQNTTNYSNVSYDFGDSSNISSTPNPFHVYSQSGTYIVCQTIIDSASLCNTTYCDTIVINILPSCNAGFSYTTNNQNLVISSTASNFDNVMYDFGDGTSSSTLNPTHIYMNSGSYLVCQTVTNRNGCSDTFCDSVIITIPPPCNAGFSSTSNNLELQITNTATHFDNIIYDFGDGTSSNAINPLHIYMSGGTYLVCQTVTNMNGCSDTFCDSIIITTPPPCNAGFTYTTNNQELRITSTAVNFDNILYDFGDGTSSNTVNPIHSYISSGTYLVCQTVTNMNGCSDTFYDSVLVSIPPPCNAGFTYSFSGDTTFFQSVATSSTRFIYRFGDGTTSTDQNPFHTYQSSGDYLVEQEVFNDSTLCSDIFSDTIHVTVSFSCKAEFIPALDTSQLGTLFLVNTSSNDNSHNYLWDFGDGNTSTLRTPQHRFSENKAYKICLTVFDSLQNCTSTYCDSIGLDSTGNILKTDGFNLKVIEGSALSISKSKVEQLPVNVFPNPFKSEIIIENLYLNEEASYFIYSIEGELLIEGVIRGQDEYLNTSHLSKGLYMLRIQKGAFSKSMKLIKQ